MGRLRVFDLLPLLVILSLASVRRDLLAAPGGGTEFDITSPTYGGKAGSDVKEALAKAWKDACASTSPSKIIIPKGIFPLQEAEFAGPCKAPIEMVLQGTLQAPEDGSKLTKPDTWIGIQYVNDFTLSGGGVFDGQGAKTWKEHDCHKNPSAKCSMCINIRLHALKNSLIKDITSLNSKQFHINIIAADQLTLDHVTITAPEDSPNTDGIHIGRSIGVNITNTVIGTGDDCISIGDGTKNLHIEKVTCGPGHGISVGSLGKYVKEESVSGIFVKNCTVKKTMTGVRIKTWPSGPSAITASDIHFEDIIMDNVQYPIVLDQEYCPYNQCDKGSSSKIKISNVSFKNIKGTSTDPVGVRIACSPSNPCDQVVLSDIDLKLSGPGELTSQCTNAKPIITNVAKPLACASNKPLPIDAPKGGGGAGSE